MSRFVLNMSAAAAVSLVACVVVAEVVSSTARVTVDRGPHAGTYTFASPGPCTIATAGTGTPGFNAVFSAEKLLLAVDVPSIALLTQFQLELVVADAQGARTRVDTASTTYAIDTRPDAVLQRYQLDERARVGMTGRGFVALEQRGESAKLTFSGETAGGTKLQGVIDCSRVVRQYGR